MGMIIHYCGISLFFRIGFCDANSAWRVIFKIARVKYQIVNRKVSGYLT